ncbi:MAG: hypothetical protein MUC72_11495 [Acidobacteria bacterium]|nr:hypothetical protein [Acidobacteriota bacterium]
MLRSARLVIHFAFAAAVFSFFVLCLIGLLNPGVAIAANDLLPMYLNLLNYYGPLWFVAIALAFFVVQFFAERKYPIGFFNPPTAVFFLSYTMLAVSVIFYANYDYYHDFFSAAARNRFIKVLLLHFVVLIVGTVFVMVRSQRKKWLQVLFLLLLLADGLAAAALLLSWMPPAPQAFRYSAPTIDPPRQVNIVIMEGLSLNYLLGASQEQKLLNLNWIRDNGVVGRLKTHRPNMDLSLLNTLLSGEPPAAAATHSAFKYQFRDLLLEFDIFPKFIFFRNSSKLDVTRFYKKYDAAPSDRLRGHFKHSGFRTFTMITPPAWPPFAVRNLRKNNTFLQFFSATLENPDPKLDVLKKTFFYDDFARKQIPELKTRDFRYSLVQLDGLANINAHYYHYARPENFGDLIDGDKSQKYGWILDKYYEYYDSVIGKIIGSMGDNELLVVLNFHEIVPMPVWRRILVNYLGRRDVFVYKPLSAPGAFLMYEKSALKKKQYLESVRLTDLFPTLLYYAGFPLSKGLQGEVVRDIFSDGFLAANPVYFATD